MHDLNQPWGQPVGDDEGFSPLQLVTMKESETLLKEFYPNFPASKLGVTYATQLSELYTQRKHVRQPLLQKIQTGNVSHKAYGARIRAVEMTRGNRQGNNAFVAIQQVPHVPPTLMNDYYASNQRVLRDLSVDFYKKFKLAVERGAPHTAEV